MNFFEYRGIYYNIDQIVRINKTKFGTEFYLSNGFRHFYPGKPEEFVELLKKASEQQ